MNKITILISINKFNTETIRCIDSIKSQTLHQKDFSVFFIYSEKNSENDIISSNQTIKNFHFFPKKYINIADSWNYGLKKASSKYILFLYEDDFLSENYLETVLRVSKEKKADITLTKINKKFNKKSEKINVKFTSTINLTNLLKSNISISGKLFESKLFTENKINFNKNDENFKINTYAKLALVSKNSSYTNKATYFENEKTKNDLARGQLNQKNSFSKTITDIRNFYNGRSLSKTEENLLEFYSIKAYFLIYCKKYSRTNNFNDIWKSSMIYINDTFPNWEKNPYIRNPEYKMYLFIFKRNYLHYLLRYM